MENEMKKMKSSNQEETFLKSSKSDIAYNRRNCFISCTYNFTCG